MGITSLLKEALALDHELGDAFGKANRSWRVGYAYAVIEQYAEALPHLQLCVDYERNIEHTEAEDHAKYIEQLRNRLQMERT